MSPPRRWSGGYKLLQTEAPIHENLREDEIEALLRLDKATLQVIHNTDLLAQAGQTYTALVRRFFDDVGDTRSIARAADNRSAAVQEVWKAYTALYNTTPQEKNDYTYLLENAIGNVYQEVINQRKKEET